MKYNLEFLDLIHNCFRINHFEIQKTGYHKFLCASILHFVLLVQGIPKLFGSLDVVVHIIQRI
ncbi:hypothetical protein HanXRQr2_Chr11g0490651 [Helianthus annuus]|uniref:Uncharacterized protein n=1 Tax=Helianthus annuus TaxID=4232 RepID=A0A9K3HPV6_HELAN|nr:hypothetical protein HanXRQr2_Chr11g0490651 [Helianthus annuus]KAJ0875154.1 hypothetical protein HanPSC8_Chr11g0472801 [Helianthus annuus]